MYKYTIDDITRIYKDHRTEPIGKRKYFSVLIPFVRKEDGLHLLFEVRSSKIDRQPGEICFPGGQREEGETARQCAVRETFEELGIPKSHIRVIGKGNKLVSYAGFTINTFIGELDPEEAANCAYSEDEVSEVFTAPLDFFMENEPEIYYNHIKGSYDPDFPYEKIGFKEGYYKGYENLVEIPIYMYGEYPVWGMTARMVMDLVETLRNSGDR